MESENNDPISIECIRYNNVKLFIFEVYIECMRYNNVKLLYLKSYII